MDQKFVALIIIIIALACLPIFYKSKSYIKLPGILLFVLGFGALALRIFYIHKPIDWYDAKGFWFTLLIIWIPALIFSAYYSYKTKFFKGTRHYFISLLPLYLVFGALQQLYFLAVVTDSILILTSSSLAAFILGAIYFLLIHIKWKGTELEQHLPLLMIFGGLSIGSYVYFHNIIPQLIVHGVVGTVLFTSNSKVDQIMLRVKGIL